MITTQEPFRNKNIYEQVFDFINNNIYRNDTLYMRTNPFGDRYIEHISGMPIYESRYISTRINNIQYTIALVDIYYRDVLDRINEDNIFEYLIVVPYDMRFEDRDSNINRKFIKYIYGKIFSSISYSYNIPPSTMTYVHMNNYAVKLLTYLTLYSNGISTNNFNFNSNIHATPVLTDEVLEYIMSEQDKDPDYIFNHLNLNSIGCICDIINSKQKEVRKNE